MKLRMVGLAAATAVLAASAIGGAVSAAEPATVNVAHGIPGVAVDVCVSGTVAKANFKYGQKFSAQLPAGNYTIRVRAHTKTPCHGTVLIKQAVALTSGLNATAVANYVGGKPALSLYVNDLSGTTADKATISVVHAARAPKVDVWLNGGTAPAVSGLARHAAVGPVAVDEGVYSWWVSAEGGYKPVIGPRVAMLDGGRAYQIIAVGTRASNYRFIVINQAGV